MKSPAVIMVLVGDKLIGIDTFLPVIMKLKSELPNARVIFLFITRDGWPIVQNNYVILKGIHKVGTIAHLFPRHLPIPFQKMLGLLRLLGWCFRALVSRTWVFAYSDPGKLPVKQLAFSARAGGGSLINYMKLLYPMSRMLANQHRFTGQKPGMGTVYNAPPDLMICYFPMQVPEAEAASGAPVIPIGNPHAFEIWTDLLDDVINHTGILNHGGRSVELDIFKLVTVFYSGDVIIPSQLDQPECSLKMILKAASDEIPGHTILVKPHPNANLRRLTEILYEYPDLKIHITDAHPQILSRLSALTIFNNGSNAMNDAYLEGVTVVETSVYRPEFLKWGDSMRPNPGRLDGSSLERMKKIFRQLRENPEALQKTLALDLAPPEPTQLLNLIVQKTKKVE